MDIPFVAMEIASQRDKYRVLYEYVLLVVRDYNKILEALDMEERKLFHDRIAYLDRRITPGVTKLNWTSSKIQLDFFVKEARKYCKEVEATVDAYKHANDRIDANCKCIAETLLINIQKKKIYMEGEFEETQKVHRDKVSELFKKSYQEIKQIMAQTYLTFGTDSEDVQHEWRKYTKKIDKKVGAMCVILRVEGLGVGFLGV